jgi:hypothetical protein
MDDFFKNTENQETQDAFALLNIIRLGEKIKKSYGTLS